MAGGSGGIGRRACLKSMCPFGCVGSIIPEREKVREAARMIADRARQVPEAHRPSLIRNTVRPLGRQRAEAITAEVKRMLRESNGRNT